jgi:hypothetical protein
VPIDFSTQDALKKGYDDAQIPQAEQEAIEERVKLLTEIFKDEGRGKYTIHIRLLGKKKAMEPQAGSIEFWLSGASSYSEAKQDTRLYLCPGKALGINNCYEVLPDFGNLSTKHICPSCGMTWKGEQVVGEYLARLNRQDWAEVLAYYVEKFEKCTNLRLTSIEKGLQEATIKEQQKDLRNEAMGPVIRKSRHVYYNFPRLAKDLKAGASLVGRMRAFLESCGG